jgi:hypothetical protein
MAATVEQRRAQNRIARKRYYKKNKRKILLKSKAWYRKNKKYRAEYQRKFGREQRLRSKYKLTLTKFNEMKARQKNCCAICGQAFKGSKDTHVDHDHKTGQIRELLCYRCNHGLGKFLDNPELLLKAADYLKKHQRISGGDN